MKVKGPKQAETWKAQMPRDEIFILACFFMQSSDTNGCEPETPHFVRGKRVCRPIHSIHIQLISCDSDFSFLEIFPLRFLGGVVFLASSN